MANSSNAFEQINELVSTLEETGTALTEAISTLIEDRKAEVAKLSEALDALTSPAPQPSKPAKTTGGAKVGNGSRKARVKTGGRSTAAKNGENGPTRRDQILEMTKEGKTPKEIADHFGIKPNYVYHVLRSAKS